MHRRTPGSTANIVAGLSLLIILVVVPTHAAEPFSPARVAVYFSPKGGATDVVVHELNTARAYSHISGQVSSRARCEVAICFNIFHRPAL